MKNELAESIAVFQRDHQSGIRRLERLHNQYPKRVDVLYALGRCYLEYGKPADAEQAWRKALRLRPEDATVQAALDRLERGKPGASSGPGSQRMSVMDLPADESAAEYQRRREEKERLDRWATARGALPMQASEDEYINLLAERHRIERKAQWRQYSPVTRVILIVVFVVLPPQS